MIIDSTDRLAKYTSIIPHLAEGIACLQEHLHQTEAATYQFEGGYLMLQVGKTQALEDGNFETHKKYLDVQILLDGSEIAVWADVAGLQEIEPYNAIKDKTLYCGYGSIIEIRPSMCYICFPHDAHKACRHIDLQTNYRKVVIKLELSESSNI